MKQMSATTARRIAIISAIAIYPLSYLALSLNGLFYPAVIGLNGVKWYSWAPRGFASETEYKWNTGMLVFYLPLWYVDKEFFHTHDLVATGEYPTSKLFRENENED
jgi:heme O synthase-like polyprenyltransferase